MYSYHVLPLLGYDGYNMLVDHSFIVAGDYNSHGYEWRMITSRDGS